tara:strand:+ start:4517 stop:4972 length:456 start_codon:yes stop_codon:yes gene_type:complete
MIWIIIGAGVGFIWGVVPACVGFLIGMMFNAIANDQAVVANAGSSDENLQDIPVLNDFIDVGSAPVLFNSGDYLHAHLINDDDSSCNLVNDGFDINPANGLPMVGCIDLEGNVYGFDDSHEIADTSFDFGCDDSFMDCSMDDSFCCGINDW